MSLPTIAPTSTRPRGYKTIFMLNSVEHKILNAHKCKNIKKFGSFSAQISLECYFFPLINVKLPTIVGILTFMGRKISCSVELIMEKFYNLEARLWETITLFL